MIARLSDEYLNKLKAGVPDNLEYYKQNEVWVKDVLGEDGLKDVELTLFVQEKNNEQLDYINAVYLHKLLSNLSPAEASDERLWAYLTHITFWDYMKARWPIDNAQKDEKNYIRTRYFFGEKPYSRNGIARLWWFGHITYDPLNEDSYHLTKLMLDGQDQDLSRMIMETPAIARNKVALKVVLHSVHLLQTEKIEFNTREFIRHAAKFINLTGSVTLWDSLEYVDVNRMITSMAEKWLKKNVSHSVNM